jgi:preprotein translocase subunit SecF
MKIFNKTTNFNFLRWIGPMAFISASLIALCFWSFFTKGFVLGLDFTGGTLLEVSYTKPIENLSIIRDTLEKAGFPDASVQRFGTPKDILIRLGLHSESNVSNNSNEIDDAHTSKKAFVALKQAANGEAELRRVEFVGPQVGNELIEDGGLAILYALIGILIYVAIRFEYRFAIGAVVATLHDVIMTIGVFSWFQIEFDLTVLAAVLAVIGYSLNDTVVVFDRIRENFRRVRKGTVHEITNMSLNETLSRTIITSGTTFVAVVALYLLGGQIIQSFSLAMLVGIFIGTYSSIYVASATVLALKIDRANLIIPKREARFDGMP